MFVTRSLPIPVILIPAGLQTRIFRESFYDMLWIPAKRNYRETVNCSRLTVYIDATPPTCSLQVRILHIGSPKVFCSGGSPSEPIERMLFGFFFGQFTPFGGIFGRFSFEQTVEFALELFVSEVAACVLVAEASKWVC